MSRLEPKGPAAVRMFCHGLGDCFLLAFRGKDRIHTVAIDSGIIAGSSDPGPKMQAVAKALKDSLPAGQALDLLVVTHEHWDHVSGFDQAEEVWKTIPIETVWLAWTEDPANPLAKDINDRRARALKIVAAAASQMGFGAVPEAASLLSFFGVEDEAGMEDALGVSKSGKIGKTKAALELAKTFGKQVEYRYPSKPAVVLIPGMLEAVILGPPEDEKLLKRSDPSKRTPEVYSLYGREGDLLGLERVLGIESPGEGRALDPFDEQFQVKVGPDAYANEDWRRIDTDWADSVGSLAMDLDSDTNNTSLAIAFHLIESGQFLIFPGDAQVGNWLSWSNQPYTLSDGRQVTFAEICAQTVFYKVGHHGSHNATLKDRGLELMTHPGLCAMIPVDKKMAVKKRWTEMPYEKLVDRLVEKTRGRVVQADHAGSDQAPFVDGPPSDLLDRPLWVDWHLE